MLLKKPGDSWYSLLCSLAERPFIDEKTAFKAAALFLSTPAGTVTALLAGTPVIPLILTSSRSFKGLA
jgi:hypothetical protein